MRRTLATHGGAGGGGGHTIPDFPAFSPVTIATFVTIFGGTGMIFTQDSGNQPAILFDAAGGGVRVWRRVRRVSVVLEDF